MRYYTHVLPKTSHAVWHFNNVANISHVLHLGDIVDGRETKEESCADLATVLNTLEPLKVPLLHVVGNHCFEAGGRDSLLNLLNISKNQVYRTLSLSQTWTLIILDSLALSIENGSTESLSMQAREYLEVHKGDDNATYYNGGLGNTQMEWLRSQLNIAKEAKKNVLVCLHHPISRKSCKPNLYLWNDLEVRDLLSEFTGTVRAVFSGHYHDGGYAVENGIHYVVFESILDSKNEVGSYGVVTLHADRIYICGHGDMTSRELKF